MSEKKLDETKNEVQKILDNHLEEDQRFSIKDLDEESTYFLIDLLLEKNDKDREKALKEHILEHRKNLKLLYAKIMEIKDKIDHQRNNVNNLRDLKNDIIADSQLKKHMDEI